MFGVSFCPTDHRTHLIFDGEEDLVEVVPEEVAGDEEGEAHAQDGQVGPDHLRAVLHAATLITALIKGINTFMYRYLILLPIERYTLSLFSSATYSE